MLLSGVGTIIHQVLLFLSLFWIFLCLFFGNLIKNSPPSHAQQAWNAKHCSEFANISDLVIKRREAVCPSWVETSQIPFHMPHRSPSPLLGPWASVLPPPSEHFDCFCFLEQQTTKALLQVIFLSPSSCCCLQGACCLKPKHKGLLGMLIFTGHWTVA